MGKHKKLDRIAQHYEKREAAKRRQEARRHKKEQQESWTYREAK